MIEQLTKKLKNNEYNELNTFFLDYFDYDFYITQENIRLYMTDKTNIKKFLKQCVKVFIKKEKGNYQGLIGIWKSLGGGKVRYYIKIVAIDFTVAKDLLTGLLWNFENDLYVKIRKDSKFVSAFKTKGFRFVGGRGCQILLRRKYIDPKKIKIKREIINGRNINNYKNTSKIFTK